MPIFEYKCEDCGTIFEKLVRNGVAVECPSCGQSRVEKQLSTFATYSGNRRSEPAAGGCPSGMCRTPDLCGLN
jgi:putative FmdB family regulatory protein